MDSLRCRWRCDPYDVGAAARLSGELGVSHTVAAVLCRRGLSSPEEARRFLAADDRHDPGSLPGAEAAARQLLAHVERGSRIVVHGDYDVDGVCSTAMLVRTLRALGSEPSWELPSRFGDGYGLSAQAVERLAGAGADLLVTVDCGITSVEEVAAARAAGLDVVVTDHHRPGEKLPDCTVVHPALGAYPSPELCASGVVLKLSEALYAAAGRDTHEADRDLDLAALATVCDLVPLRGENRWIVRAGLESLARSARPGLRALMRATKLDLGELSERALAFRLGPRLNAAGRMRRADAALELLLTEDEHRAEEVARELDLLNRDRQEAETRILFAADAACAEQAASAALVVAGEGWHPGVVGIVASRLVERWSRPCVVIGLEDGGGRGSARSIPAYDLHAGLAACASHLRRFGGHRAAAGLEIDAQRLEPFRRALAEHAGAAISPHDLERWERIDAVVPGGALGLELAEELEILQPFGPGNPEPTLLVPAARVEGVAAMGSERQHARFTIATGASRARAVAFGASARSLATAGEQPNDVALRLERNRWNGLVEPRAIVRGLCPTPAGSVLDVGGEGSFWELLEREMIADLEAWPPPAGEPCRTVEDRRHDGFAGVVGDLLTSGAGVLVVVADVPRRRAALQTLVGALARDGLPVTSWEDLLQEPGLARPFEHLVALDPPPLNDGRPGALPSDAETGRAHLCWTASDVDFALGVWRHTLDLRAALADVWRGLKRLPSPAGKTFATTLRGPGRYPRSGMLCGRLLRVLVDLELVEYERAADGTPGCRVIDRPRTDLERSPSYRAYRRRLAAVERALSVALPQAPAPRARQEMLLHG